MNFEKKFTSKYPNLNSYYLKKYLKIVSKTYCLKDIKFEKHHILPKSLFNQYSNRKSNIVKLPIRVHFIVHWILTKMIPDNKEMALAYCLMCHRKKSKLKIRLGKDYLSARALANASIAESSRNRILLGIHNFCGESHPSKIASKNKSHHLFGGEIQKKSNINRSKNKSLPVQKTNPWNCTMCNEKSLSLWRLSDKIFDFYNFNDFGYKKIHTVFVRDYNLDKGSPSVVRTMINKFDNGWIPSEDIKWLEFRNEKLNE